MTPVAGMRISHYELLSHLGSGGMGQVWKARDTRLDRFVAIKFSNEKVSSAVEHEARSIAALNHRHICTLYDVGENYLVMEFIKGECLSGPMPLAQSFEIAIQIADALDAAHRIGIVHLDLKPANILLTKDGVKLLDFGISKWTSESLASDLTQTQTATATLAGTLRYMSPEQLQCLKVDARSDLFAFGAVLYELITGEQAFAGDNAASVISEVLKGTFKPTTDLHRSTSPFLEDVIRVCLAKNPDDRWQSARELKHLLTWLNTEKHQAVKKDHGFRPAWIAFSVAAAACLGSFIFGLFWGNQKATLLRVQALTYSGGDSTPAASPDGRFVAFSSDRDGTPRIWLKQLQEGSEIPITDGPDDNPRFSPDSSILLFSRTEARGHVSLYRVAAIGGQVRKIIDDVVAGDFSPDGRRIAFIRWQNRSDSVKSILGTAGVDGSEIKELTSVSDVGLNRPRWSSDGSKLAMVGSNVVQGLNLQTWIANSDGSGLRLLKGVGAERGISSLAWLNKKTVAYTRGDRGVPVDGELVLHNVVSDRAQRIPWSCCSLAVDVSPSKQLLFDQHDNVSSLLSVGYDRVQHWITRGNTSDRQPSFHPDGKQFAFVSNRNGRMNLWQMNLGTGSVSRLTQTNAVDFDPAFSADGKHLVFSSDRTGKFEIYYANADGTGIRQITNDGVDAENPTFTPDGKWIFYASANPAKLGIWKVHPDGSGAAQVLRAIIGNPEVSPDGAYVAYVSNPTPDAAEIRVIRTPDGSSVPFRIICPIRRRNHLVIGRVRWIASARESKPRALAFIAQDEAGATGVYAQDFIPGEDTSATRKLIMAGSGRAPVETLGVSPDGKMFVVSVTSDTMSIMEALDIPGFK